MPEQGGLCASAEDGQNAALDRVQKRVWLAGIGARLPQIREAVAQRVSGSPWSAGLVAVAFVVFRAGRGGRGLAGGLSSPCSGYLLAVELGQVVGHHQ